MFEPKAIHTTTNATASTPASALAAARGTIEPARATYRRLRIAGLSAREAGSLTAHLSGLRAVDGGWAIEEVERLLFVRELVRTGRIGS